MVDEVRLERAVTQLELDTNRMHIVVNGDGTSSAVSEDGSLLPSVRKAMLDNLYFVTPPLPWTVGAINRVFNQLYSFTETDGKISWWFAPSAGQSTPVTLGQSPVSSPQWRVFVDTNAIAKIYAPIDSPLFTGNPRAPTPASGDDSQSLATTEFVMAAVGGLINKNPTFDSLTVTGLSTLEGGAKITGDINATDEKMDLNKLVLHKTDASITFTDTDPTLPVGARKTEITTNKVSTHKVETAEFSTGSLETDDLKAKTATISEKLIVSATSGTENVAEFDGRVMFKGPVVDQEGNSLVYSLESPNFKITSTFEGAIKTIAYDEYIPPNGINVLQQTYNPTAPVTPGTPVNPIVVMMSTEENNAMRFDPAYPAYETTAGMKVLISKDPTNALTYREDVEAFEGLFVAPPADSGGSGGGLIAVRTYKATTSSLAQAYSPTPGTKSILIKMIGGGGAGGDSASTAPSAGGGGGSGQYGEAFLTSNFDLLNIVVGRGGSGTIPAGGTEVQSPSGNFTIAVGRGIKGDNGVQNQVLTRGGFDPDTNGTNLAGVYHVAGTQGGDGLVIGTIGIGGRGASSPFGSGGESRSNQTYPAGADGAEAWSTLNHQRGGFGSGGGGGVSGTIALTRPGGDGAPGLILIYEFG